jgi:uncharacterized protein YecE (DUF72 family)
MNTKIKIGTCSWKYDSWQGMVYSATNKADYLQEYAQHFNTVEVDQWFWSLFPEIPPVLPKTETAKEYAAAVPAEFEFSVKVPNSITLTHFYNRDKSAPLAKNPHFLSNSLFDQFLGSIEPMHKNLGPIMFQFEYLNKQKMLSASQFMSRLGEFIAGCPNEFKYAVELRNPNFISKDYFAFLNQHKLAHVFLQGYFMPSIFSVFRHFGEAVQDWSIIRLHGPDRSGIEKATKGDWSKIVSPKDDDLSELHEMLTALLSKNTTIYINVNNHYEGSAPRTIDKIRGLFD